MGKPLKNRCYARGFQKTATRVPTIQEMYQEISMVNKLSQFLFAPDMDGLAKMAGAFWSASPTTLVRDENIIEVFVPNDDVELTLFKDARNEYPIVDRFLNDSAFILGAEKYTIISVFDSDGNYIGVTLNFIL